MSIMERVEALRRMGCPESLDEPLREDSEVTRVELLEGTFPSPEDFLEADQRAAAIDAALRGLTPREERVIRSRFGIGIESETTREVAGEEIERARRQERRIEARALRKLHGVLSVTLNAPPVQFAQDDSEAAEPLPDTRSTGSREALARDARALVHAAIRRGDDLHDVIARARTAAECEALREAAHLAQSKPVSFAREHGRRLRLQRRARAAVAGAIARGREPFGLLRRAKDPEYVAELVAAIREAGAPRRTRRLGHARPIGSG